LGYRQRKDRSQRSTRLREARINMLAFTERLLLENLAADYRRGRNPTKVLIDLVDLQASKEKAGI